MRPIPRSARSASVERGSRVSGRSISGSTERCYAGCAHIVHDPESKDLRVKADAPITQTINADDAGAQWDALVARVARGETRVLVESNGEAVAAIVSVDDLERLNRFDADVADDLAILEASQAAFTDLPENRRQANVSEAVAAARATLRRRAP